MSSKRDVLFAVSLVLKVMSVFFSVPLVLYCFFLGIGGVGPDGPVDLPWQLIGIVCLLSGVMCWVPNKKIIESKIKETFFLMVTFAPVVLIGAGLIYHFAEIETDVKLFLGMFFLSCCFALSPSSYLLFKQGHDGKPG